MGRGEGGREATKKNQNAETVYRGCERERGGAKRCSQRIINNRAVVIKHDKRSLSLFFFPFSQKEKKRKK